MYKFAKFPSQLLRLLLVIIGLISIAHIAEACQTPRGTTGACVFYGDCSYVVNALREHGRNLPDVIRQFILKSRCIGEDTTLIHICCELAYINTTIASRFSEPVEKTEVIFANSEGNFEAQLNASGVELLRHIKCGVANIDRIAYGVEARIGEFPWMALLRYDNPTQPFQCGGSLVTHRFVVTAAHCLVETSNELLGVRLGEHNIKKESDCITRRKKSICYTAEDFGIEQILAHPDYNRYRYTSDIGLIKLDRDVEFKNHISPICLPLFNRIAQATEYPDKFIVAGWGTTETGDTSKTLMKATVTPKARSYCQNRFQRVGIHNEHLCAGGDERVDACRGDSGGPLFAVTTYELTARYILFGVVSFGSRKCGDENAYPGVYTNVAQFMPWITNHIIN